MTEYDGKLISGLQATVEAAESKVPRDSMCEDEELDETYSRYYEQRGIIIHERSKGFWRTYWPAVLFLLACGGLAWLAALKAWPK